MTQIEATHLGKQSAYPKHYDKSVLVAVPRIWNRQQYQILNEALPFSGVDVWHAYEFSFLTQNGLPVNGVLKFVYDASNEFLVESKSLKLYLNSFNMDRYGRTPAEGIALVLNTIETDLSALLQCSVWVSYFNHSQPQKADDFTSFEILEDRSEMQEIAFEHYTETPSLLSLSEHSGEIAWGTHTLRSNCKITHQPDWGSLYIRMKGKHVPNASDFLKYVVSLRNENHFHEEICEMVFKRITDIYKPEKLQVACLYTRRGGIDICPVRTHGYALPPHLTDVKNFDTAAFRQ